MTSERTMPSKPKVIKAWAITANLWPDCPPALLGLGCWNWPKEPHAQGCPIALFATRKVARTAKAGIYYAALSRVVRVTVTIKEVSHAK